METTKLEGRELEVFNAVKELVEEKTAGAITEKQMNEAIAAKLKEHSVDVAANDEFKQLKKALEDMGITVKKMTENNRITPKSIREQIKEQIIARKDEFEQFRTRKVMTFDININKVAAEMSLSNMGTGVMADVGYIEPGITMPMRHVPRLLDLFNGSIDRESFSYTQMVNADGAAVVQADGTIAPLVDFDLSKATSTANDAVARVDISEDLINDHMYLETTINQELEYQVDKVTESTILTTAINAASAYALTTVEVVSPNNLDAIRAMVTQIEDSGFGTPDTVVLRPVDWMNLVSAKSDDADYVMLPMVTFNGTVIDNLRVFKSTLISAGNALVFDSTKVNFLNYKPFTAQLGWIANNFAEFVVTIRGKRRFHSFVKSNHNNAFCYDALADVKTAITLV